MDIAALIVVAMTFMTLSRVHGARILGVFPLPAFSHQKVFRILMTELHSRGHEIVIITTHPMHNQNLINYTEIDMSSAIDLWNKQINYQKMNEHEESLYAYIPNVANLANKLCKLMFALDGVQILRHNRKKKGMYDLVITAWNITPCSNGFAYYFSAPIIGISTLGLLFPGYNSVGNPTHPVYFMEIFNAYLKTPTFWQKLDRLIYYFWNMWFWHSIVLPQQDMITRQYFGDNMPYLGTLHTNASLVFTAALTNHYSVVPKVPALMELGPIHLQEIKALPKDLQEHLDGAFGGAIYFSFGTQVRSDRLTEEKKNMFLSVFSELTEFRIIWKWDGDDDPDLPSNVMIGRWFPQSDILAHPKMKAFIYQGGLQSTEEAIKFQVPVIGFPFAVDQEVNLRRVIDYGAGIKLDIKTVNKDIMLSSLNAVIFDPKYKSNMKRLSDISGDQPQTPMEQAVWWIEYVIRHKGARHMRAAWMDLTWYEYLMLDVIAFLIVTFSITVYTLYYVCSRCLRKHILFRREKRKIQ